MRWFLILILPSLCLGCRSGTPQARTAAHQAVAPSPTTSSAYSQPLSAELPPSEPTRIRLVSAEGEPQHAAPFAVHFLRTDPISEPLPAPREETLNSTPLTFERALTLALAQNPDLNTLRGNQDVGVAAFGVAQTYPFNPQYFTQTTPWGFERSGSAHVNTAVNTQHQLLETFELAGQRHYRAAAGGAALNGIRWNIHQAELRTLADTQRIYFVALYQREVRDVAAAALHINEQVLDLQGRRFQAGQATPADLAQSKLDNRAASRQLDLAEANFQTAVLDLQRQLNWWPDSLLDLADRLPQWQWRPASGVLGIVQTTDGRQEGAYSPDELQTLVSSRPDVQASAADVDVARANLELASANRHPNLIIGPFYEHDDVGTTLYGFKGGFDIPVVNTGRPLVRQRQAELGQRQNTYQQLLAKATTEVRVALQRYERARRLVERGRGDFEADFPDELRQVEDQFRAGQVDILRLFAARTTLLQDRRAYLDLHNELAQAAASVTLATGLPPEALVQRIRPEPLP
jgi:outer membrane protein, heavy metal efflux system